MKRGIGRVLLGCLVLVALAACGRWIAQREPWRREAEEQCLRSGAVRESPAVALLRPINGPGVCGADYPLKVGALGESSPLGYADEPLRPPATIVRGASAAGEGSSLPPSARGRPERKSAPGAGQSEGLRASPGSQRLSPRIVAAPLPEPLRKPSLRHPETALPYPLAYPPNGETAPIGSTPTPAAVSSGPAAVSPPATLACPVASALDRWVTEAVQPAARRWFAAAVVEIRQISAYSCRGMNGNPHARISEHAFGNALDIAAFVLADGRRITVQNGWRGAPEEQGFLRDVQAAACGYFSTVLAPGSNQYHYNHIHVDLMRRASGRAICQPEAVSGEVVAGRARARLGYAGRRPGDASITGSIGRRGAPRAPSRHLPDAPFAEDSGTAEAIPGED